MTAITNEYLGEIILRIINKNIATHRASKNNIDTPKHLPYATNTELLDFIQSIPYLDVKLKDFLVGNLKQETIIISQAWEIQFIKHCTLWAESFEWLHGNNYFLSDVYLSSIKKNAASLSLPY
ncbi:MAG: hypothetical protein JSU03_01125 [Bacteroidetes bacterium]|nr:hypothetical protein [Bacteroidota bacterium]MBS1755855.1 hypothetical protein [Bacteroidota bacterium]